jgi:hypothetical protein|tara:strand:+ start:2265 stop:2675 length:411 start_codon:yes stop_codon:yes gene_type:complete
MKSFKTYLREVSLGTGTAGISADGDFDFHRIDQDDVRARVNTWLSANMQMEFTTVNAALNQLAGKVQQIGITFDVQVEAAGESGSLRIPLSVFGEKADPAGVYVDNMGSTIPEGLVLDIQYEKMPTGGFRVSGQIQ